MKKIISSVMSILILMLSVCGCTDSTINAEKDSTTFGSISLSEENAAETSKITETDTMEIASQYWGIKSGDIDEQTGFTFLIVPVENSNDNIVIALKWLVNNDHYSTVDSIAIDPYTGKIVNRD